MSTAAQYILDSTEVLAMTFPMYLHSWMLNITKHKALFHQSTFYHIFRTTVDYHHARRNFIQLALVEKLQSNLLVAKAECYVTHLFWSLVQGFSGPGK